LGESDGEPVTLLDCQLTHFESQLFGNPIAQTLIAMRAFVGIHLDVPDQVAFKAISIKIENLHVWAATTGLTEQVEFEDGRQRGPVIRADFPEERSLSSDGRRNTPNDVRCCWCGQEKSWQALRPGFGR